ncbi:thiamine diphosphokinase [Metabacillus sp. GX 13764]|uniref:thiamine diphosphokinase n=1 Tax=Metabacillus kandeliae TaxID=2900151 RepID=UPI001E29F423|nr:thiamine diphosphokinase [Metabacillus kandeliae]MCD7033824.1 thiamine diphosphokinase [Metabacillus kandeliae]
MKIIGVVAGGPRDLLPDLKKYQDLVTEWAGADRGVVYLADENIAMAKALGDFDSISKEEREELEQKGTNLSIYPSEKDKTDTELALDWAIEQKPDEIYLFGTTGGRLDHLYANIFLLMKQFDEGVRIILADKNNEVTFFKEGSYEVRESSHFPYLSFIPFKSDVKELTLEGFKYPLHKRFVPFASTLCISNELIQPKGTFSFKSGILMMVRSRDDSSLPY